MKRKILLFVAFLAFTLMSFGQATINCFPDGDDYNTGTTDGTDFTETSLIDILAGGPQGWARFSLGELPEGATIQEVTLHLYITADNNAWWKIMELTDDPLLGDAASVYQDISDGDEYAINQSNFPEPGWYIVDLGAEAVADLQTNLDDEAGWFGVGVYEYETSTYAITCDGWEEDNPPYVEVTYLVPGAPLPPFNPYPPHASLGVDVEADLSWDFGDATLTYDLYFGTDFPPMTKVVDNEPSATTGTYDPGTMEYTSTYYWQVIAKNDADLETPGPVWSYTTSCDAWEVPFYEDFDAVPAPSLPYCWTGIINTIGFYAYLETITYNGIDNSQCVYFSNSDDATAEMIFVTPQLEGGAAGMYANFWAWGYSDLSIGTMADPADPTTFTPLDTVTPSGVYQDYMEFEIFFTNYTGTDEFIAFKPLFPYTYAGVYMDNIFIDVAPNCPKPTDLYAGVATTNTATVGWTESGDATQWNIEYGFFGFTPTGVPTVSVTDNPTELTGLEPGTVYEFYVQADCGTDDESYWVGPMQFQTMCLPTDVPYFEGFEDVAIPDLPPCVLIENNNGDDKLWYTANDNSYNGDNAIRVNYNYAIPMDDWFFSAGINLLAGETYLVQFYYTSNSSYYTEKMEVKWGTSALSTEMSEDPIFTDENINYAFTWYEGAGYITPEEDGVYYVGWHGYSIANQYNLYVDDIIIDVAPTCIKPSTLKTDSISSSSATVSWFENGDAALWNIEYVYAGDPPTGVANVNADSNPFNITGLEAGTAYDFYVQADCGEGDLSWWAGSSTFSTLCEPGLVPIDENFDGVIAPEMPDCWRGLVESSGTGYVQTNGWNGYSPTNALQLENAGDADATIMAISPPVADDEGLAGKWVRFYAWGYASELVVGTISNPFDASTFNAVSVVPLTGLYGDWHEYEVYFTNYTGTDEMIAFKGVYTTTYQTIYIDDVHINHPPSCPKPTDLSVSDISTNTATLHWAENGEATTWHLEYGYENFMPSGTPMLTVDENPYELMALESGTSYDWYVQAFCEVGDSSEWQGPFNFITHCEPFDVPVMEDFDAVAAPNLPPCWSPLIESTSNWAYIETYQWTNYTAPNSLYFYCSDDMFAETYFVSPTLIEPVNELWINFFAQGYAQYMIIGVMSDPLDATTFTAVDSVMLLGGNWQEYEVFFDEYVGDGEFIAMRPGYSGTYQSAYVDNITIDHPPTCPKPSDLYYAGATQSSATVGWEENGGATTWNIEYDYEGFIPTGIANAIADSNPFEITGLEDGTYYDFYVQADCGTGDQSYWVGPFTFKTLCFATVLAEGEYYEYFENVSPPNVPPCIDVENTNGDAYFWHSSFNYPYSGLSHLQIGYTYNNPMDDWFYTAPLELLGGQTYNVYFHYTSSSTYYTEAMEVKFGTAPVSDSMTSEQIWVDDFINYGSANYQDTVVQIIPDEDGTYFVGWHGMSSPGQDYLIVDDIMIEWDNSLVVIATALPDTICQGAESQLNGEGVGGSGIYDYSWTSNPAGFTSTDPNPIVSPDVTTDYILEIYDSFVSIYDTVTVHVTQLPATPTTPTGITFFCASWGSATYSTTTTSGANWYDWVLSPEDAGVMIGTGASVSIDWNEGWLGLATLSVIGMHDDCAGTASGGLNINVYLPDVQLPDYDTACLQWPAFELTGGTPAGGEYTGPGVDDDGWFDPAVAGIGTHTITYTYSDPAACENYAEATMIVDACVGIDDYASNVSVMVTPNPNNGIFTLKVRSAAAEKVNVKVLNNFGEEVYNDNNVELHQNYSSEIDLSKYAKGLYYLYIYSDNVNYVEKIIVK